MRSSREPTSRESSGHSRSRPGGSISSPSARRETRSARSPTALYDELRSAEPGTDVIYDDRDAGPGEKLTDAELLGCPVRLLVGRRGLADGVVEATTRADGAEQRLPLESVVEGTLGLLDG